MQTILKMLVEYSLLPRLAPDINNIDRQRRYCQISRRQWLSLSDKVLIETSTVKGHQKRKAVGRQSFQKVKADKDIF